MSEEIVEGGAERDLVNAARLNGTGECDQRGSGLVGRADLPEPLRPEAREQRDVRHRLDVLDKDAALKRLRTERRLRGTTLDELGQRRLLAGDECPRRPKRTHADTAVEAPASSNLDLLLQCGQFQLTGAAECDQHFVCAHCLCSEDGTVEDEVRGVAEQHPVLAACRLALDAVDDHAAAAALGDCRQLARGWETATAAAGQSALGDEVDQAAAERGKGAPAVEMLLESGAESSEEAWHAPRGGHSMVDGCRAHWLFSPLSSEDVSGAAWIVPVTLREPASICSRMTSRSVEPDEEVTSAVTSVPCSPTTEPE